MINTAKWMTEMGRWDRALELCEEALPVAREQATRADLVLCLTIAAHGLRRGGEPIRAMELFRESEEVKGRSVALAQE